jgi:hypothetical protein
MRNLILFPLFWLCLAGIIQAQSFEQITLIKGDNPHGTGILLEPKEEPTSILLLLPGFGQTADQIFPESKVQNVAYVNQMVTFVVPFGSKLYLDEPTIDHLNIFFDYIIDRYPALKNRIIIGGFSAGGTLALQAVEMMNSADNPFGFTAAGVFTVDSPVDIVNLWEYFQNEIARDYSEVGINEAEYVAKIMEHDLGGTPYDKPEKYDALNPFSVKKRGLNNAEHLRNTPVRCYHDADINWQITNRRRDVYNMNVAGASKLINSLQLAGNQQAELVLSKTQGIRSDGSNHPHSWSIVNEPELVQWIKSILP